MVNTESMDAANDANATERVTQLNTAPTDAHSSSPVTAPGLCLSFTGQSASNGDFETSSTPESSAVESASPIDVTTLCCTVPLVKLQDISFESKRRAAAPAKKFLCLYCDRTFVTVSLRQKHVDRCHSARQARRSSSRFQSRTPTVCIYCKKLNNAEHTLSELFRHLVQKHPTKYFACLECEERFSLRNLLDEHNLEAHNFDSTAAAAAAIRNGGLPGDEFEGDRFRTKHKARKKEEKEVAERRTLRLRKELRKRKVTARGAKSGVKKQPPPAKTRKRKKVAEIEEKEKNCINPYPTFDAFFRVKKITDHSIDNLKISSLTFDDVFDKAFYNRIKCNIQENLQNHIDGKLFNNEESENRISNFEKMQEAHNTLSENFGCDITLNAATPVVSLLSSQLGEDLESQIEYGAKASKKKVPAKKDEVHYKYFTRRKYQASILENKENRDLSKLDMWTQLIVKDRQQKIINDQKTDKERIEYTKGIEYKTKMQNDELNRILDRRGPFEDLKEEANKMAAIEKMNQLGESASHVSSILDEIFSKVFEKEIKTEVETAERTPERPETNGGSAASASEIPLYLNLQKTSLQEEDIDRSDKITLICSSQETENFELTQTPRDKNSLVELTGEWTRTRLYICAACGARFSNVKLLLDHKGAYHPNVWVQHYEFVGNQSDLYRNLSIPGLGKVGHMENNPVPKLWRRSDARSCTKCAKACNSLAELHRHMLECGEDWSWMLARKKLKYRPFGSKSRKKRRGLVKRIIHKESPNGEPRPKRKYNVKPKHDGPRQRPSDAETIQRMLANLPAKRATRKLISLKEGISKPRRKQIDSAAFEKQQKKKHREPPQQKSAPSATKASKCNPVIIRKSVRNLNKVLASKVLDSGAAIRVKRKLRSALQIRTRSSRAEDSEEDAKSGLLSKVKMIGDSVKRRVLKSSDNKKPKISSGNEEVAVEAKESLGSRISRTLALKKPQKRHGTSNDSNKTRPTLSVVKNKTKRAKLKEKRITKIAQVDGSSQISDEILPFLENFHLEERENDRPNACISISQPDVTIEKTIEAQTFEDISANLGQVISSNLPEEDYQSNEKNESKTDQNQREIQVEVCGNETQTEIIATEIEEAEVEDPGKVEEAPMENAQQTEEQHTKEEPEEEAKSAIVTKPLTQQKLSEASVKKSKKKSKGLNDCIAMLTSKLQQKTENETAPNNVENRLEEPSPPEKLPQETENCLDLTVNNRDRETGHNPSIFSRQQEAEEPFHKPPDNELPPPSLNILKHNFAASPIKEPILKNAFPPIFSIAPKLPQPFLPLIHNFLPNLLLSNAYFNDQFRKLQEPIVHPVKPVILNVPNFNPNAPAFNKPFEARKSRSENKSQIILNTPQVDANKEVKKIEENFGLPIPKKEESESPPSEESKGIKDTNEDTKKTEFFESLQMNKTRENKFEENIFEKINAEPNVLSFKNIILNNIDKLDRHVKGEEVIKKFKEVDVNIDVKNTEKVLDFPLKSDKPQIIKTETKKRQKRNSRKKFSRRRKENINVMLMQGGDQIKDTSDKGAEVEIQSNVDGSKTTSEPDVIGKPLDPLKSKTDSEIKELPTSTPAVTENPEGTPTKQPKKRSNSSKKSSRLDDYGDDFLNIDSAIDDIIKSVDRKINSKKRREKLAEARELSYSFEEESTIGKGNRKRTKKSKPNDSLDIGHEFQMFLDANETDILENKAFLEKLSSKKDGRGKQRNNNDSDSEDDVPLALLIRERKTGSANEHRNNGKERANENKEEPNRIAETSPPNVIIKDSRRSRKRTGRSVDSGIKNTTPTVESEVAHKQNEKDSKKIEQAHQIATADRTRRRPGRKPKGSLERHRNDFDVGDRENLKNFHPEERLLEEFNVPRKLAPEETTGRDENDFLNPCAAASVIEEIKPHQIEKVPLLEEASINEENEGNAPNKEGATLDEEDAGLNKDSILHQEDILLNKEILSKEFLLSLSEEFITLNGSITNETTQNKEAVSTGKVEIIILNEESEVNLIRERLSDDTGMALNKSEINVSEGEINLNGANRDEINLNGDIICLSRDETGLKSTDEITSSEENLTLHPEVSLNNEAIGNLEQYNLSKEVLTGGEEESSWNGTNSTRENEEELNQSPKNQTILSIEEIILGAAKENLTAAGNDNEITLNGNPANEEALCSNQNKRETSRDGNGGCKRRGRNPTEVELDESSSNPGLSSNQNETETNHNGCEVHGRDPTEVELDELSSNENERETSQNGCKGQGKNPTEVELDETDKAESIPIVLSNGGLPFDGEEISAVFNELQEETTLNKTEAALNNPDRTEINLTKIESEQSPVLNEYKMTPKRRRRRRSKMIVKTEETKGTEGLISNAENIFVYPTKLDWNSGENAKTIEDTPEMFQNKHIPKTNVDGVAPPQKTIEESPIMEADVLSYKPILPGEVITQDDKRERMVQDILESAIEEAEIMTKTSMHEVAKVPLIRGIAIKYRTLRNRQRQNRKRRKRGRQEAVVRDEPEETKGIAEGILQWQTENNGGVEKVEKGSVVPNIIIKLPNIRKTKKGVFDKEGPLQQKDHQRKRKGKTKPSAELENPKIDEDRLSAPMKDPYEFEDTQFNDINSTPASADPSDINKQKSKEDDNFESLTRALEEVISQTNKMVTDPSLKETPWENENGKEEEAEKSKLKSPERKRKVNDEKKKPKRKDGRRQKGMSLFTDNEDSSEETGRKVRKLKISCQIFQKSNKFISSIDKTRLEEESSDSSQYERRIIVRPNPFQIPIIKEEIPDADVADGNQDNLLENIENIVGNNPPMEMIPAFQPPAVAGNLGYQGMPDTFAEIANRFQRKPETTPKTFEDIEKGLTPKEFREISFGFDGIKGRFDAIPTTFKELASSLGGNQQIFGPSPVYFERTPRTFEEISSPFKGTEQSLVGISDVIDGIHQTTHIAQVPRIIQETHDDEVDSPSIYEDHIEKEVESAMEMSIADLENEIRRRIQLSNMMLQMQATEKVNIEDNIQNNEHSDDEIDKFYNNMRSVVDGIGIDVKNDIVAEPGEEEVLREETVLNGVIENPGSGEKDDKEADAVMEKENTNLLEEAQQRVTSNHVEIERDLPQHAEIKKAEGKKSKKSSRRKSEKNVARELEDKTYNFEEIDSSKEDYEEQFIAYSEFEINAESTNGINKLKICRKKICDPALILAEEIYQERKKLKRAHKKAHNSKKRRNRSESSKDRFVAQNEEIFKNENSKDNIDDESQVSKNNDNLNLISTDLTDQSKSVSDVERCDEHNNQNPENIEPPPADKVIQSSESNENEIDLIEIDLIARSDEEQIQTEDKSGEEDAENHLLMEELSKDCDDLSKDMGDDMELEECPASGSIIENKISFVEPSALIFDNFYSDQSKNVELPNPELNSTPAFPEEIINECLEVSSFEETPKSNDPIELDPDKNRIEESFEKTDDNGEPQKGDDSLERNVIEKEDETDKDEKLEETPNQNEVFDNFEVPVKTTKFRGKKGKGRKGVRNKREKLPGIENLDEVYCDICNRSFTRMENLVKHKKTLTHIAKLSEIEAREAEIKAKMLEKERKEEASKPDIGISDILASDKSRNATTISDKLEENLPFSLKPGNNTLNLVDIINDVLDKPMEKEKNFNETYISTSAASLETKRYKSLGERKSFESDINATAYPFSSMPITSDISPKIPNATVLKQQLTILENIIERGYIDDITESSNKSSLSENKSESYFMKPTSENFVKPPTQYEEISNDSLSVRNQFEEQSLRKVLNRDEALFLECCSLLKSSSEVSDFSKKSSKQILQNTFGMKQSDEPEWLESKSLKSQPYQSNGFENSCPNTPLGDGFGDEYSNTNSNTIATDWSTKQREKDSASNDFEDNCQDSVHREERNFSQIVADRKLDDDLSYVSGNEECLLSDGENDLEESELAVKNVSKFGKFISKTWKNSLQSMRRNNSKQKRKQPSEVTQTSITDYAIPLPPKPDETDNKKVMTKGAMKVFEGLKVSIPTDDLDLRELLNGSYVAKRDEERLKEPALDAVSIEEQSKRLSESKKSIIRTFGNSLGLKITKKKHLNRTKDDATAKEKAEDGKKGHDVYDFEETQDNTDLFGTKLATIKEFRTKEKEKKMSEAVVEKGEENRGESDSESQGWLDKFGFDTQSVSSYSSESSNLSIKQTAENNITKKKCMIMGRIFKNAFKTNNVKDLPTIDNAKFVEDYVNHLPSTEQEQDKRKLSQEEMDDLFNKLLDDSKELSKAEMGIKYVDEAKVEIEKHNTPKAERKSEVKKNNNKSVPKKKRQRNNSGSTDDEFSLSTPKRASKKRSKNADNSINLEQELRECIGVASRKSQRTCTSGKQNVLVEYWSSDDSNFEAFIRETMSLESKNPLRPKSPEQPQETSAPSANSLSLACSDNKKLKMQETEQTPPIKPASKAAATPRSKTADSGSKAKQPSRRKSTTKAAGKAKKAEDDPEDKKLKKVKVTGETLAANRRKRPAADTLYYWSSSSEDESRDFIETKPIRDEMDDDDDDDDIPVQHGWIVGESTKKLVTMLAQAKGKKTEADSVKEQGRKRTTV